MRTLSEAGAMPKNFPWVCKSKYRARGGEKPRNIFSILIVFPIIRQQTLHKPRFFTMMFVLFHFGWNKFSPPQRGFCAAHRVARLRKCIKTCSGSFSCVYELVRFKSWNILLRLVKGLNCIVLLGGGV